MSLIFGVIEFYNHDIIRVFFIPCIKLGISWFRSGSKDVAQVTLPFKMFEPLGTTSDCFFHSVCMLSGYSAVLLSFVWSPPLHIVKYSLLSQT